MHLGNKPLGPFPAGAARCWRRSRAAEILQPARQNRGLAGGSGSTPTARHAPKRFHGTGSELDPKRVGRDASRIADEVISHLEGLVGSEVTVTIEIDAKIPCGRSSREFGTNRHREQSHTEVYDPRIRRKLETARFASRRWYSNKGDPRSGLTAYARARPSHVPKALVRMAVNRTPFEGAVAFFVNDDLIFAFKIGKLVRVEQRSTCFVHRPSRLAVAVTIGAFRPAGGLTTRFRGKMLRRGIDRREEDAGHRTFR